MKNINSQIQKEIVQIHQYFEDWYNGSSAEDYIEFDLNVSNRFCDNFKIVMPDGTLYQRNEILKVIKDGYGTGDNFQIEIKMISTEAIKEDLFLVLYEEWHSESGKDRAGRIAAVILKKNDECVLGYEWIHCHESPIQI